MITQSGTDEGSWVSPGYRSARTRYMWTLGLLIVALLAALSSLAFVLEGFRIEALVESRTITNAKIDAYVATGISNDRLGLLTYIATALAFLAWLSRSVENVPPLGGGTPKDSPRASIYWWFIPIAWFFKPYQIVSRLYRSFAESRGQGASSIVLVWWLCFVGQAVIFRAALAIPQTNLDAVKTSLYIELVSAVANVAAAILAIVVVRRIQHRANQRTGELGLGPRVLGPVWPVGTRVETGPGEAIPGGPKPLNTSASEGEDPDHLSHRAQVAFCPRCGAARLSQARYCGTCGNDLDA